MFNSECHNTQSILKALILHGSLNFKVWQTFILLKCKVIYLFQILVLKEFFLKSSRPIL